ncbi:hypothetical protein D5125_10540 [Magnetovirga frankeli]|uniref:SEL1-like repeat protein n=1 Tax=Magnetovirga frankeli TaxID=947516 RepID=UPI001293DF79|nr:hypothetical protein D5125_10540 [gamma proteobacterium SS-5]
MFFFDKLKKTTVNNRLVEETQYEEVMNEIRLGFIRDGLWAKALAESSGNENKAMGLYIKYRVQSMKDELEIKDQLLKKMKAEIEEEKRKKSKEKERQQIENDRNLKERRKILLDYEEFKTFGDLEDLANTYGYSKAKFILASIFYEGKLVKKDDDAAKYWLKCAANEEYEPAKKALDDWW